MAGCRPLTQDEIEQVAAKLKPRDRVLFLLGVNTGFRISELLSLRVKDLVKNGVVKNNVTISLKKLKGKSITRTVPINDQMQEILAQWLESSLFSPESYVFPSRKGNGAITRIQAHRVLVDAFDACSLEGKTATHSMRKTFAKKVHEALGNDVTKTMKALGHEWVTSTQKYLDWDREEIDDGILRAMAS